LIKKKLRVKFDNSLHLRETIDAIEYKFPLTVVESSLVGEPEEQSETKEHIILTSITGTLASTWGLFENQLDLEKVLYEYSKRHVIKKLKDGTLGNREELWLSNLGYPSKCPFDPSKIKEPGKRIFDFDIPEKFLMQDKSEVKLASSIIDTRDNINAIFSQKYNDKLLLLDQERNLLDFFREANSQEEFFYRIASLTNIIGNLNITILRKITGINDKSIKSISLLETYFRNISNKGENIIKIFRSINKIRQGYPIHGDQTTGLLEAYRFFEIEYPLINYKKAWKRLLSSYLSALKNLLEIVKKTN